MSNLILLSLDFQILMIFFSATCNGFQCPTSYCISSTLRCNGVNDCAGGEDEQNCGK